MNKYLCEETLNSQTSSSLMERDGTLRETITRFPLSRFEEIAPVLSACFPDFWSARFARNERSFAYDLKLFAAKLGETVIGTVGIHDYRFILPTDRDTVISTGGICDLGVLSAMRHRGYAGRMQDFVKEYIRCHRTLMPLIPLYTDKPGVYLKRGWRLYSPDRSRELCTEDFPKRICFQLDPAKLRRNFIRQKETEPMNREEEICQQIQRIYNAGKTFPGKAVRSPKIWLELFSDPAFSWNLDGDTYFLYCKERLIEACSADPAHRVNRFTPVNGNCEHNCIMLNFLDDGIASGQRKELDKLREAVQQRTLQFPFADQF